MEVLKIWTTLIYLIYARRNKVTFKTASLIRDYEVTIWDKGNNQFYALSLQNLNVLWYFFLNLPRLFRYNLNQIPYDYTVEVRNRFKGLVLIDRVSDELWLEVRDIVQETGIKTIPMEKKCKKAKWLSGEALQIAVKRREVKSQGEKERYKHLNAEFQRIVRRDKKAFFSDQCKEIEENNRMGKTRDLFKKIRDTKGTFHVKMGTIKDRNGMDLTEAEDIKKM